MFIECTATDLHKAKVVLNTVACMFAEYCEKAYTIHPVDVQMPDGSKQGGSGLFSSMFVRIISCFILICGKMCMVRP